MSAATVQSLVDRVWHILDSVPDPEIPVLSVLDLGIVRDVIQHDNEVEVCVTPTYSGCPATEVIEQNILRSIKAQGIQARVTPTLSPPWTTDWITERGRERLKRYGISPPDRSASKGELLGQNKVVLCPRCESDQTKLVSEFGSTPCKSHYQCQACLEPFDHFKCI